MDLPLPVERTELGPGDTFSLQIVGEKDLPEEFQVASDGTVQLPYVEQLKVSGLEPQQVARLVRESLIKQEIWQKPVVIVRVTSYGSQKITLLGQVQKPGSFPHSSGLTLLQVVSLAGGFNSIANKEQLRITRRKKGGGEVTVVLSAEAITDGDLPDVPLQAGDRIYVPERVF